MLSDKDKCFHCQRRWSWKLTIRFPGDPRQWRVCGNHISTAARQACLNAEPQGRDVIVTRREEDE